MLRYELRFSPRTSGTRLKVTCNICLTEKRRQCKRLLPCRQQITIYFFFQTWTLFHEGGLDPHRVCLSKRYSPRAPWASAEVTRVRLPT